MIKQWNSFLSSSANKTELIKFIVNEWRNNTLQFNGMEFYVTSETQCFYIHNGVVASAHHLFSTQEEADTRLLLHAKDAASICEKIVIHTPDTDVFLLAVAMSQHIDSSLYIKTGVKNNVRLISIADVAKNLPSEDISEAIIGLHAFTGCDTVNAFHGEGKIKALKLMIKEDYVNTFKKIGMSWEIDQSLYNELEVSSCLFYLLYSIYIFSVTVKVLCQLGRLLLDFI